MFERIDLRLKKNWGRKPGLLEQAIKLRMVGLTTAQIAAIIGVNPSWVSMYLPLELRTMSGSDLRYLRHQVGLGRRTWEWDWDRWPGRQQGATMRAESEATSKGEK